MNLSPYPHEKDLVVITRHSVTVDGVSADRIAAPLGAVRICSATFQGNDRPALTAYATTPEMATAALYNSLTVEYEIAQEVVLDE